MKWLVTFAEGSTEDRLFLIGGHEPLDMVKDIYLRVSVTESCKKRSYCVIASASILYENLNV